MKEEFELIGHSCLLGSYPSPVVPIIEKDNRRIAIYSKMNSNLREEVELQSQDQQRIVIHSTDTKNHLRGFNYKIDLLFAYSAESLDFYSEQNEAKFLTKLLENKDFSNKNPFFRFSLAKATLSEEIINQEMDNCINSLKKQGEDEFIPIWCKTQLKFVANEKEQKLENIIWCKTRDILKDIIENYYHGKQVYLNKESFIDELVDCYITLARIYTQVRKFLEAETLYLEIMKIREKNDNENSLDIIIVNNNLGIVYFGQNKYQEAKKYFGIAKDLFKAGMKKNEIIMAKILANLAEIYEMENNFVVAEENFKKALEIYEKYMGYNNADAMSAINGLGVLYFSQGKYKEAEQYINQSLEIAKNILGEEDIRTARIMNNLGQLYNKGSYNNAEKAELLLKKSLRIKQDIVGDSSLEIVGNLNSLGKFYFDIGEYTKAEQFFKKALSILETFSCEKDTDTIVITNNLGEVYILQKRYTEAEEFLLKSLSLCKKFFGSKSMELAVSLANIGQLYYEQKEYAKAEESLKESVSIIEDIFGKDSPNLSGIIDRLAAAYKIQNKYPEAQHRYEQSLEIANKLKQARSIAASKNNLALLYFEIKNYSEAESLLKNVLEISKNTLECDYRDITATLNNLSCIYYYQKNDNELKNTILDTILILEKELNQHKLKDIYSKINVLYQLGNQHMSLAVHWGFTQEQELALEAYEEAFIIAKGIDSIESKKNTFIDICEIYFKLRQFDRIIHIAEKTSQPIILELMGKICTKYQQEYLAIDFYRKALNLSIQLEDFEGQSNILYGLSDVYSFLMQPSKAKKYFEQSLQIKEKLIISSQATQKVFGLDNNNTLESVAEERINKTKLHKRKQVELSILPNCLTYADLEFYSGKEIKPKKEVTFVNHLSIQNFSVAHV